MTLGAINGISIESILQRIPDTHLRTAYRDALERFSTTHSSALADREQLAEFLSPTLHRIGENPSTQARSVDYNTFFNAISDGSVHGDEYVAAAYLLAAMQNSSSLVRVNSSLFRMNPLWQEHQVLLDQFDFIRDESREVMSEGDRVSHLGSANHIIQNAQSYIRHVDALPREVVQAWSALETYRDAGLGTHFLDLQDRTLRVGEENENFRISHHMSVSQFQDYLDAFEAGTPKQFPASNRQCLINDHLNSNRLEPFCAPNDPSCED